MVIGPIFVNVHIISGSNLKKYCTPKTFLNWPYYIILGGGVTLTWCGGVGIPGLLIPPFRQHFTMNSDSALGVFLTHSTFRLTFFQDSAEIYFKYFNSITAGLLWFRSPLLSIISRIPVKKNRLIYLVSKSEKLIKCICPIIFLNNFIHFHAGRGVRAKRNIPVGIFLCCYFGIERTGTERAEHGDDNGYTVTFSLRGRTITYVDFPSFLQSSLYRLSKTQLSREIRYK